MERSLLPLAIPFGALIFEVLVIFLLSRVLLGVSKEIATPIALFFALAVLGTAAVLANRPGPDELP